MWDRQKKASHLEIWMTGDEEKGAYPKLNTSRLLETRCPTRVDVVAGTACGQIGLIKDETVTNLLTDFTPLILDLE
jgi:hypothetical protein